MGYRQAKPARVLNTAGRSTIHISNASKSVVKIQRLTEANASLLSQVADGVFDHPIIPSSLHEFIACPRHVMMLAVDDGQVIGMASGVEYFHPDKQRQFWINEIGVTPKRQRQGIGQQLLESLLDQARQRQCNVAWLGTETSNIAAIRCYSKVPDGESSKDFVMYEWKL
ncbi:MAG: GNAT family N-acetyltransferase [Planctomycetota bacterium]